MNKKIVCFSSNIILGFISVWWFIISYVMAFNIDNKRDVQFLVPFGYVSLIVLIILVLGINYLFMKKSSNILSIIYLQITPFVGGILIGLLLTFQ